MITKIRGNIMCDAKGEPVVIVPTRYNMKVIASNKVSRYNKLHPKSTIKTGSTYRNSINNEKSKSKIKNKNK